MGRILGVENLHIRDHQMKIMVYSDNSIIHIVTIEGVKV